MIVFKKENRVIAGIICLALIVLVGGRFLFFPCAFLEKDRKFPSGSYGEFSQKRGCLKAKVRPKGKENEIIGKGIEGISSVRTKKLHLGPVSEGAGSPHGLKSMELRSKQFSRLKHIKAGFLVKKLVILESRPIIDAKKEAKLINAIKSIGPPALLPLAKIVAAGKKIRFGVKTISFGILFNIVLKSGPDGLKDAMRVLEGAFDCKDKSVKMVAILFAHNNNWCIDLKRNRWLKGNFEKIILKRIVKCILSKDEKIATAASNFVIRWLPRPGMVKYWKRIRKILVSVLPYVKKDKDVEKTIKWLLREMDMRVPL